MVAFIPPQVPTPASEPPSGSEWIHEIKHDGFRTILAIDGKARAFIRNGYDWTARYAPSLRLLLRSPAARRSLMARLWSRTRMAFLISIPCHGRSGTNQT